ncbi:MAG: hypothetical protein ABIP48_20915 [Planctomycetota bacterium]
MDEHPYTEDLQFESKSHHVRHDTLKTMRKLYLDPSQRHSFMEVELALSAHSS